MQDIITGDRSIARTARCIGLFGCFFATLLALPHLHAAQSQAGQGLDRVVAVVNGDSILSSDLEREASIESCSTSTAPCLAPSITATQHEQALQRLIDRQLIRQQMQQVHAHFSAATTDNGLCTGTEFGSTGLQAYGITPQSLQEYCGLQSQELAFIEQQFRHGIHIGQDAVAAYYRDQFVPQYLKTSATPPPLSAISTQISSVLKEREVSLLFDDWLRFLRAQSTIVILPPAKVRP